MINSYQHIVDFPFILRHILTVCYVRRSSDTYEKGDLDLKVGDDINKNREKSVLERKCLLIIRL